ncbi:hypothetical protein [uncultured Tateyamaria sp.]|uniref:O-antigen ligase family protein n=1 Tax=uncultured Tateyamaria sp. TaxID=455651 RepID=UPI002619EAAB|nr:hypothetical protein [uncultured Tateyamaria sp.]
MRHPTFHGMSLSQVETWLVLAVVFLAPMNFLRLPNVYVTASDIMALFALAAMTFRQRMPLKFFGEATSFWIASLILLQTGLLIGSLVNGDPRDGLIGFAQYGFSMFLLPVLICNRPLEETLGLIKAFVLSLVVIMAHGAYVVHYTPDDLRFMSYSGRLTSLIERENAAGTLAALAIVYAFFLAYVGRLRVVTFGTCIVVLVYGLMLTASNTGFFLAGIGVIALAVFTGSLRLMGWVLGVGFVALIVTLLFGEAILPEIFVRRVMATLTTGDITAAGTFTGRMALISEAMGIARDTLFVGLGIDQYRVVSLHGAPVHNTYLLLLTEGSLMALLGLMGLFVTGIFLSWRALQYPQTRLLGGASVTVLLMFALAMNGFAHVYARFWAVPFILALALSAAAVSARADPQTQPETDHAPPKGAPKNA